MARECRSNRFHRGPTIAMNTRVAKNSTVPTAKPTTRTSQTRSLPASAGFPTTTARAPATASTGASVLQMLAPREAMAHHATTCATTPSTMTAAITATPPAPHRSREEPHLGRKLRREGGDHGEVEEAGGRLDGGRARASQRRPDQHGDECRRPDHPERDPRREPDRGEQGVDRGRRPRRSEPARDHRGGLHHDGDDEERRVPVDRRTREAAIR